MLLLPQNKAIDTIKFANMLEYRTQSASYKPLWLDGILQAVKKGKKEISFKEIACHMISKAWYPILFCKLSFGYSDSLPKVIGKLQETYGFKQEEKPNELFDKLCKIDDKKFISIISVLYDMVPYRLLSSFYKISASKKSDYNKQMFELTTADENAFYKFNISEKKIILGDAWYQYIKANQSIIEAWIEYSLVYYLQKKNPNVPAIPLKINPPLKRELGDATKLWNYFASQNEMRDIYINQMITEGGMNQYGSLSIDHFIPWSFVLHDETWNLIPSFKNINSSKNNGLPNLQTYLKDFCQVQYQLFDFMRSGRHEGKQRTLVNSLLEDYVHIMPANWNSKVAWHEVGEERFKDYLSQTITPLYQIAYNQGYSLWEYKGFYNYSNSICENELIGKVSEKIETEYMK